jgi:alkylation response protein AidB-like acyl-CoA dehydrogenase
MELAYRMRGSMFRLADTIRSNGLAEDRGIQRDLGRVATQVDAVCALADRFLEKRMAGEEAVGDASAVKNAYSRALRAWADLGLRGGGLEAQYREAITFGDLNTGNWMADFMNSYAWTIAGGSEEIQRNIIAERMLGMPREPKEWQL